MQAPGTTNQLHRRAAHLATCFVAISLLTASQSARAQKIDWGPFKLNIGFSAGVTYTDNVNSSEDNPESDIKLTFGPTVTGGIVLPITLRGGEKLTIQTGATYSYQISLKDEGRSSFGAPVAVSLVIPIEFENWSIVAADSFTLKNDPLESAVAITEEKSTQYNNNSSIGVSRNFGRAALTLSAGRRDKISPDLPELEETQYTVSLTPAFFFRENYSIFWRNSVGVVLPEAPNRQESTGWSTEVGLNGQLTPYLSGIVSVGFAHSNLKEKRVGPGTGIFGGIFDPILLPEDNVDGISSTLGLSYSHPLRPNTAYAISFFRSPGVTAVLNNSAITETMGVNLGIAHRLSPRVTLSPAISWTYAEDASQTGAGEKTSLIAIALGASRSFTRQLSGNFSYRFQARTSNLDGGNYEVNRVSVSLSYTF